MRVLKIYFPVTAIIFFMMPFSVLNAQDVFEGTINNYEKPSSKILTGMMMPFEIGTVDQNGTFSIPLDEDFLNVLEESIEKENQNSNGWSTSMLTTGRMFSCSDGDVEVTNTELPIANLSTNGSYMIGNPEEEVDHGYFMATSSSEFTEAVKSFGQSDAVPGYYLDWYYFEEPFSVSGSCEVKTYAMNQEDLYMQTTTYNLDFKEGWNLVKFEISDIYEDPDGTNPPMEMSYSTINDIPAEVVYYFFE